MSRHRKIPLPCALAIAILLGAAACQGSTLVTCSSPDNPQIEATEYFVSLADAADHIAHVSIRLHEAGGTLHLDMPVWNALYQVRNFAANIENVRAQDSAGTAADISQTGTSQWDITNPGQCVVVHYDVHLDKPGPFGSQLDAEHGFFNWAMVLMYSPELRNRPASIRLLDIPPDWALRDTHVIGEAAAGKVQDTIGIADNYDTLADSPAVAGVFQEYSFQQDGATYHIVVRGDPAGYNSEELLSNLKRITHAAVDWMQDRPFDQYTFLYDFPHNPAAGGMEHAYGTAISASDASGKVNLASVMSISAHEFFHLWNVKRIRPQALEPIDYQHEQDTRALWFSEGVTDTVGSLIRARAGVIDEQQYLQKLSDEITEFEGRPAHVWQSAEDSSLQAWFEGDAFYRTPQRSISYYNKGDILGVLLDLRIRQLTDGRKSLRDLFQWMNERYARQHRYFPGSAGVQQAAEAVTGQSFAEFFRDYVAGVKPIPYNQFFSFVGLQVVPQSVIVADAGFTATSNLDGQSEVTSVSPGSAVEHAGLKQGDRIVAINGRPATYEFDRLLANMLPDQTVELRVERAGKQYKLKFKLGSRQVQQSVLADNVEATPAQHTHRTAWIRGDDESGGAH